MVTTMFVSGKGSSATSSGLLPENVLATFPEVTGLRDSGTRMCDKSVEALYRVAAICHVRV